MRDFYFNIIFLKPVNYERAGPTTKKLNWCGLMINKIIHAKIHVARHISPIKVQCVGRTPNASKM
jgi:hypothetical protein